jgi:hypothetical protein
MGATPQAAGYTGRNDVTANVQNADSTESVSRGNRTKELVDNWGQIAVKGAQWCLLRKRAPLLRFLPDREKPC